MRKNFPLCISYNFLLILNAGLLTPIRFFLTHYQQLLSQGKSVLLDNRDLRAGVKFKDMDLVGIPIRITVGRGAKDGIVEIKNRENSEVIEVDKNNVLSFIH